MYYSLPLIEALKEGNNDAMHDRLPQLDEHLTAFPVDLEADTARWTSPAYHIRFGHIAELTQQQFDIEPFHVSAWGLSDGLSHLLMDYEAIALHPAFEDLISQQNAHMVLMLNQAMEASDFNYEVLDQVFISIDTEIFLPRGLRMHVTCVTNIVQVDIENASLDKFVAVLDPGEVEHYIRERRGMTISTKRHVIH